MDKSLRPVNTTDTLKKGEKREQGEVLHGLLTKVFDELNSIPSKRRLEKTKAGIYPIKRSYEKKKSKFRIPTTAEINLGRPFSFPEDRMQLLKDVEDFWVQINTGETSMFGGHADSYRIVVGQHENQFSIQLGRGQFSKTPFDYPTILEIVITDKGKVQLGENTRKDWLVGENVQGLLSAITNITTDFLPVLVDGFAEDVKPAFRFREPQKIQEALQILEDLTADPEFDSQLQALFSLGTKNRI
ncbi:hypothetical protein KBD71_02900 [Candidatus Woesebacteria bacterium]|nr:hypothetical protein [Candidatus Woesebacteria bacterium]